MTDIVVAQMIGTLGCGYVAGKHLLGCLCLTNKS